MRQEWDVVVVGGGPAGSTTALLAAAAGARVALLERATFPRDKVCGEFVSAEGCRVLERLGLLGELTSQGAQRIEGCRLSDLGGRRVDSRLPLVERAGREALGVSRALLDATLLDRARRRGATVLERHEATGPVSVDGRVVGVRARPVGRPEATTELRAALVVAADGRRSVLGRHLHPTLGDPRRSRPRSWFGLKTHLRADPRELAGRVELHLFDGGYAGLGPVEDGRMNLCLVVRVGVLRAAGGSPPRLVRERVLANPALREIVGDAPIGGPWHSVGPLRWGVRRPTAAGVLFVGDAAGTIDPFCGEGIANALRGAEIALPWALRAIERGRLTTDLARGYRRAWLRAFGPVTRRVRPIGYVLERPALARPMFGLLGGLGAGLLPRIVAATRTGA